MGKLGNGEKITFSVLSVCSAVKLLIYATRPVLCMSNEDKLFEIADRQQGYFTAAQAKECGYYDSHFRRYLSHGEWIRTNRGLYRLSRYPVSDRPDLIEWSLWSRNKQG